MSHEVLFKQLDKCIEDNNFENFKKTWNEYIANLDFQSLLPDGLEYLVHRQKNDKPFTLHELASKNKIDWIDFILENIVDNDMKSNLLNDEKNANGDTVANILAKNEQVKLFKILDSCIILGCYKTFTKTWDFYQETNISNFAMGKTKSLALPSIYDYLEHETNLNNQYPLHLVAASGSVSGVKAILEQVDPTQYERVLAYKNKQGQTPIEIAKEKKHKLLINYFDELIKQINSSEDEYEDDKLTVAFKPINLGAYQRSISPVKLLDSDQDYSSRSNSEKGQSPEDEKKFLMG